MILIKGWQKVALFLTLKNKILILLLSLYLPFFIKINFICHSKRLSFYKILLISKNTE